MHSLTILNTAQNKTSEKTALLLLIKTKVKFVLLALITCKMYILTTCEVVSLTF